MKKENRIQLHSEALMARIFI